MPTYRTFRNTDPPHLAAIWQSRAIQPGLLLPVSADLFEQFVFSKPYFDRNGLLLAFEGEQPLGFAHAAFGPTPQGDGLSHEHGVTCLIVVRPDCAEAEVAGGLLRECEAYLRRGGARLLYGGSARPMNPFYQGLYGGCESPGILESDTVAVEAFQSGGYEVIDRTLLFRRDLAGFRPPIDRKQMQLRRKMLVEEQTDPPAGTWWQACTRCNCDLVRFDVRPRDERSVWGSAVFRAMPPVGNTRGTTRASSLIDLRVVKSHRRQGLAAFLLAESFRRLDVQLISRVEALATEANPAGIALCKHLGMDQYAEGLVFRKAIEG